MVRELSVREGEKAVNFFFHSNRCVPGFPSLLSALSCQELADAYDCCMHAIVDFVRRCPTVTAVTTGFWRKFNVSSADVYRGGADVLDPFAKVFARAVEGRLGEYEDSEVSSIVFAHHCVLTVEFDTSYGGDRRRFL